MYTRTIGVWLARKHLCVCAVNPRSEGLGGGVTMPRGDVQEDLPTTHVRRVELRDAKMWRRESERQLRTGESRSRCPCTLCLFGRPLLRRTHATHLRDFGRHPMRRLQPQVRQYDVLSCVVMRACMWRQHAGTQDFFGYPVDPCWMGVKPH